MDIWNMFVHEKWSWKTEWVMAIVELRKENHIFVCLPFLVLLLVPAAAAAAAGACAGGGWDIGDGGADAS